MPCPASFFLPALLLITCFGIGTASALTAEEWVAEVGSFETGQFATVGSATGFGSASDTPAPMDGWSQSGHAAGSFASEQVGSWIEDSALAHHGNRFVSLRSHGRINEDAEGNVTSVDHLFGGLGLRFGGIPDVTPDPGLLFGPALAAGQTYELSFWMRDFGVNATTRRIPVFFFDHSYPLMTYVETYLQSPLLASDPDGDAVAIDPNDPAVLWTQHVFTFTTTDGNGTFGIHLSSLIPFDTNLVSHTLYLDNFQLSIVPAPVPEPAGAILLALPLMAALFRRSRAQI